MSRSKDKKARSAKANGLRKKRRRHYAERREATKHVREKFNEQRRAEGHPGWVQQPYRHLREWL